MVFSTEFAPDQAPLDRRQIARLLTEWGRQFDDKPIRITGPLSSRGFSRVFRAEGGIFTRTVAIKQFLPDPTGASPGESARAYFYGLQRVAEVSALRDDVRAAAPLALLDAHGIVVTSWIAGPTLAQSLFGASTARAQKLIRTAGMWLGSLHRGCGVERRPPNVADMLARLTEAAGEVRARSLTGRALALLHTTAPLVAAEAIPWSRHYGDFKPDNLIVQKNQLVAIDVELLFAMPTVNDAAHFLNSLQLDFYSPYSLLRWRDYSKLTGLFCQGYAEAAGEPLPDRLLAWQRLYHAVNFLLQYEEWSQSLLAWPMKMVMNHLVHITYLGMMN
jgi:tRNA A-37 threonylcarbamoyl transferase component Bud32